MSVSALISKVVDYVCSHFEFQISCQFDDLCVLYLSDSKLSLSIKTLGQVVIDVDLSSKAYLACKPKYSQSQQLTCPVYFVPVDAACEDCSVCPNMTSPVLLKSLLNGLVCVCVRV